jgi:hypothetical protein
LLSSVTDDAVSPQKTGDQAALRTVLLRWDVTNPTVTSF